MASPWKTDIVRTFALSLWGLLTLVLLFTVLMLVNQMLRAGQDPLEAMRATPETNTPRTQARPALALGLKEVALFFADADGRYLSPQVQALEFTDSTVENCRTVLEALIVGPKQGGAPVLSPAVRVRAIYLLENGDLVVDFSREFASEHARVKSASMEALMVQAIATTLAQGPLQSKGEPAVRRVRILVEGSPPTDAFPAHVDLSEPVEPDSLWVAPESEAPAESPDA